MTRVVIGIDGGGTTTDVIVADLTGEPVASVTTGPTNHEAIGVTAAVDVLGAAIAEVLALADADRREVAAAVFGLAGIDWPSDVERLDAALGALRLGGPRWIVNDSQVALRAGCTEPWGIVSSVGTGSVTAGRARDGRWFRSMAVGFGEPSGSGTIARRALDAVAAHHHGTAPATELTHAMTEALGAADVLAMFEAITRGGGANLRALAPLVTSMAAEGDTVARSIVADVAAAHADVVIGVAGRLDLVDDDFELVTAGSVHAAGGVFTDAFAESIGARCRGATIVALDTSPAVGAVRLALDLVGNGAHDTSEASPTTTSS